MNVLQNPDEADYAAIEWRTMKKAPDRGSGALGRGR